MNTHSNKEHHQAQVFQRLLEVIKNKEKSRKVQKICLYWQFFYIKIQSKNRNQTSKNLIQKSMKQPLINQQYIHEFFEYLFTKYLKQSQYQLSRLLIKQIFGYTKLINFYIISTLMNQQFELKLLLKQNSEMVSKMQIYRRQNQLLIEKNQDLNLWVQNLSQVFAAIGAAWKIITNNEEALYSLMKKSNDPKSKGLVTKYVSHFKTFDDIINNLGEKITNSGHSNEVTVDVKSRLNAFVQNYELFFKEIVDNYFKFNDEYFQWATQLKNKPQIPANLRELMNKELQNRLKIKEFQNFMGEFRGRFKIYEAQNQHKLLDGILFSKIKQLNSINQLNQKQTRRIHLMMNYTSQNAQAIIESKDEDYECFCGGIQLQYFKRQWEKHLKQSSKVEVKNEVESMKDIENGSSKSRQDYQLLKFEKQKLIQRITNIQGKLQKAKIQNRLTQDLVMNSSAYFLLYGQAHELIDFVDQLIHKITNHYKFLEEIQKARQQQILELKSKLQKSQGTQIKTSQGSPKIKIDSNLIQFKSEVSNSIKELKAQYFELNSKITQKQEVLSKAKQLYQMNQQEIKQLNKKVETLEANKPVPLQFRHERFNEVEKKIQQILENHPKDKVHLLTIWKQFIDYVKSRDKKVKDLQAVIKKRQKEVSQKDKLLNVLQQSLKQTENVFLTSQTQVKKIQSFIQKTQKQLHSLAQKNIVLKTDFENEKNLLNYKMKAQSQAKLKMEQKLRYYQSIDDQIKQVRRLAFQAGQNYENWIMQQQHKLSQAQLLLQELQRQKQSKRIQSEQKDKAIKKINQEKERFKSQFNKLGAKMHAIEQKSQVTVFKMELQEYKRKLMCNCSRDQQRSVVLKTCPHAFCKKCIQDMNNSRNRKCPLCGVKFGKSDVHEIILS